MTSLFISADEASLPAAAFSGRSRLQILMMLRDGFALWVVASVLSCRRLVIKGGETVVAGVVSG